MKEKMSSSARYYATEMMLFRLALHANSVCLKLHDAVEVETEWLEAMDQMNASIQAIQALYRKQAMGNRYFDPHRFFLDLERQLDAGEGKTAESEANKRTVRARDGAKG